MAPASVPSGVPRAPSPAQRLALADLRRAVIAPIVSPLPTAVALVGDALADRSCSPAGLRRAVVAQLRARDVAALAPLRASGRADGADGRPNEIVPASAGASMEQELEALAAIDPGALARSIQAASDAGHPVAQWRPVARDPARWLRAYAEALRRAWSALEPFWTRCSGLLDRELERVGVALA